LLRIHEKVALIQRDNPDWTDLVPSLMDLLRLD
jgi:hypothetical protein